MKLKSLRPILWTDKLPETVTFYCDMLGFSIREQHEEWGWASLHHGDVEIMLAKPNAHTPFHQPTFTGSFYFNIDNVDELWLKLKDHARICYEIETFEWQMREFAIYDNNGYILQFGQEVARRS